MGEFCQREVHVRPISMKLIDGALLAAGLILGLVALVGAAEAGVALPHYHWLR
jgi:hypothetical protein